MLSRNEFRHVEKLALPFDSRARAVTRTAIAVLVVLLAAWVARDFLAALIWAAVIAISAWPIYIRFAAPILGGPHSGARAGRGDACRPPRQAQDALSGQLSGGKKLLSCE
jgi:hypothetical protein